METQTQKTWHDVDIKGKWVLTYKVGNSQGPEAFGGYHLPVYPNPFTGQTTYLRNVDKKALNGYLIDKLAKPFDPEENPNQKLLISWLICHPEVKLKGVKNIDETILKKKITSKITLEWINSNVMEELDQEYYQDKLIGTISADSNKGGLSLMKMRYVLAFLNLPYRDLRFAKDYSAEKKSLRSKLSSTIRNSYDSAKRVGHAIDNMDSAEKAYIFKEIVRTKVIELKHGIYYYNDTPVGGNQVAVIEFMENHPELKAEIISKIQM